MSPPINSGHRSMHRSSENLHKLIPDYMKSSSVGKKNGLDCNFRP